MRSWTKATIAVLTSVLFFGSVAAVGAQTMSSSPPPNAPTGRRINYSISQQRVALFEANGQQIRSYAVSGRAGWPRPGTYHVFSKSKMSRSGSLRLANMVRFVPGKLATGFHAIPVRRDGTPVQSEAELGQYRSHGCVRQRPADAAFLYDWAPIGTTVVVTP